MLRPPAEPQTKIVEVCDGVEIEEGRASRPWFQTLTVKLRKKAPASESGRHKGLHVHFDRR